jgi:hypothetical protein
MNDELKRILQKAVGAQSTYWVLRRMNGRRVEKLHDRDLHNLYCSPDIIRTIKSRRMGWAVHIARIGRGECI